MPSISFVYGDNGEVVGEAMPITSPTVKALSKGDITAEDYFKYVKEEAAANQELRGFMYSDRPLDFMPNISRVSRWRGWLKHLI